MTNKIIALDIGNVCFRIDKNAWLDKLDVDPVHFLRKKLNSKKIDMELGIISQDEFLTSVNELTNNRLKYNELISIYCSVLETEIFGMNELVSDLVNSGYKIMFFSDISSLHKNEVYSRLSFANLIIGGVYSYKVGAFKPDIKMFNEFEKRYGKPQIYIDDLENNCSGAVEYGWDVHCFVSAENCRKELLQKKLLHN